MVQFDSRRIIVMMLKKYFLALVFGVAVMAIPEKTMAYENQIEQVQINLPDVTVYYRSSEGTEDPVAYLGGEKLVLSSLQPFSETQEPIAYYVALDISASVPENRFEDIKNSLRSFLGQMREQDKMILYTFGDMVQNRLTGGESRSEAAELIGTLVADNQNTLLFEALETIAKDISLAQEQKEMRRVMTVISDGKDCADNTKTAESIKKKLQTQSTPVFTFAVENIEGDTEAEIHSYRSSFSSLATDTGGIPWTIEQGYSVWEGLKSQEKALLESTYCTFRSSSNITSNRNEDFVLTFPDKESLSVPVLVARSQPDTVKPEIISLSVLDEKTIEVSYSETMDGAEKPENYQIMDEGNRIPVSQVIRNDKKDNTYNLVLGEKLRNGNYSLSVTSVYDHSNEKNALSTGDYELKVTGMEEEPEPTLKEKIVLWWPVILTAALAVILVMFLLFFRRVKKKQVVLVDDRFVEKKNINEKVQLHVAKSKTGLRSKKVRLQTRYQNQKPEFFDYTIYGSAMVGRKKDCDISCDDTAMSGQHFILSIEKDGRLWVMDTDSTNGTFVNGKRIQQKSALNSGDLIKAGNLVFQIEW